MGLLYLYIRAMLRGDLSTISQLESQHCFIQLSVSSSVLVNNGYCNSCLFNAS